jgi:hypothetical protein
MSPPRCFLTIAIGDRRQHEENVAAYQRACDFHKAVSSQVGCHSNVNVHVCPLPLESTPAWRHFCRCALCPYLTDSMGGLAA